MGKKGLTEFRMGICRSKSPSKWPFCGVWCRSHPWSGFGGFGLSVWNKMWMLCAHWLLRFGHVSYWVPSCTPKLQPGGGKGEEGLSLRPAAVVSHETPLWQYYSKVWRCKAARTRSFKVRFGLFWDKFSCEWCLVKTMALFNHMRSSQLWWTSRERHALKAQPYAILWVLSVKSPLWEERNGPNLLVHICWGSLNIQEYTGILQRFIHEKYCRKMTPAV